MISQTQDTFRRMLEKSGAQIFRGQVLDLVIAADAAGSMDTVGTYR